MSDDLTPYADASFRPLEDGLVKFPPNVHGVYVTPLAHDLVTLEARQNETRLRFVLDEAARRHLAAILLRDLPEASR